MMLGRSPKPIHFRQPRPQDGPAIHRLIAACPPLDTNSLYCNLLQCSYFASTCILAQRAEHTSTRTVEASSSSARNAEVSKMPTRTVEASNILGFVSGLWLPEQPATLFIWQVAVAVEARGQSLGVRMLENLLRTAGARRLQTTVTPSNSASWAMFTTLARQLAAPLESTPFFDRHMHFEGAHESELLVSIGPLPRSSVARQRIANEENA